MGADAALAADITRLVRESDDHFYGAWKGGAKGSGGRPATPTGDEEWQTAMMDVLNDTGTFADFGGPDRKGMAPGHAPQVAAEYKRLAADYPDTAASVSDIMLAEPGTFTGYTAMSKTSYADCAPLDTGTVIRLSAVEFAKPELGAQLKAEHRSGWKVTGDIAGIVSHEFGHAYHFKHKSEVDAFMDPKQPGSLVQRMFNSQYISGRVKAVAPSLYAKEDMFGMEHFAELFSEATSSRAKVSPAGQVTRQWLAENGLK